MIEALSFVTVLVTFVFAAYATKALYQGHRQTVLFIIIAHFFLYGVPVALDLTIGRPEYELFEGFHRASNDVTTHLIACLVILTCPCIWWWTAGPVHGTSSSVSDPNAGPKLSSFCQRYRSALVIVMLLPLVMLIRAPDLSVYYDYAPMMRLLSSQPFEVVYFHAYLQIACITSVVAACGLLLASPRLGPSLSICLPTIVLANWLVGKRAIVAVSITMFVTTCWFRGVLRGWRIVVAGGLSLVALMVYSLHYQQNLRGLTQWDVNPTFVYDSIRIDFGRDDVLKLAIYAELNPREMQLMDFRGESLWIYATLPIPRHLWPDKPLSYGARMACEALLVPHQPLGWGMTTSLIDEGLANFGWLGILAGPLCISFVCRYGDSAHDGLVSLMTVVVGVFLLTLHLSATAPFVLLWFLVTQMSRQPTQLATRDQSPQGLALPTHRIG